MTQRVKILPAGGPLLVSTDLHGNAEDFTALRAAFVHARDKDPRAVWVILGDAVHGPDARAREERSDLYDYPDASWEVAQGILSLRKEYPENVLYVLGNHDHGHVGGPHAAKFHDDEVENFERSLTPPQVELIKGLFRSALLAVISPCGALLAHGSPDDTLVEVRDLDSVELDVEKNDDYRLKLLKGFLTCYGQSSETTRRFLATVSEDLGFPVTMVIHGHDRDEEGWFAEGGNQFCPVIFGAPRENKRYLLLDGGEKYISADAIREGIELQRVHARR